MVHFPKEIFTTIVGFLTPHEPDPKNCLDTVAELKRMLRNMKLKVGGTKLVLIKRLLKAGKWAKRPYWDSLDNAAHWKMTSPCPRAFLSFDTNLHTVEEWKETTRTAIELWQREGEELSRAPEGTVLLQKAEEFEDGLREQVAYFWRVGSMHGRYLNEMDNAAWQLRRAKVETNDTSDSDSESASEEEDDDSNLYHPTELFSVFDSMRKLWALTHKVRDRHGLPTQYGLWDLRAASLRD